MKYDYSQDVANEILESLVDENEKLWTELFALKKARAKAVAAWSDERELTAKQMEDYARRSTLNEIYWKERAEAAEARLKEYEAREVKVQRVLDGKEE